MTPRTGIGRRYGRDGEHGQMIVLFALCLVAIIAVAGLLIDGGLAWSNRRQAQAAADTAALAAAKAIVGSTDPLAAARAVAGANGFQTATDCQGNPLANNGIVVNHPPTSGPHTVANDPLHASDYVEVITTRKMTTTFSGALGMSCWMVSARAVSSIGTSSVAKCSFCSLNNSNKNHTLVLKNGATLRVDGDIYVNSTNGGTAAADCDDSKELKNFFVCGDGFDVFGDGGLISAQTISVVGGWETHDQNPTVADGLAKLGGSPCPLHPDPPSQVAPWLPSNVCIHMPSIADPLNDSANPKNIVAVPPVVGRPVANQNGCPAGALIPSGTSGSPSTLTIASGTSTICPGTYYGGIRVTGGTVTMMAGVYYIAGGGFTVLNAGSVNGSAGVMIYNASGAAADSTNPGVDLVPAGDKSHKNAKIQKGGGLTASPNKNVTIGQSVTLTFEIERNKATDPLPTGLMSFYDGQNTISGCSNLVVVPGSNSDAVKATCVTSWGTYGTKSLSAVYFGDAIYNGIGDTLTLTLSVPAGATIAPVDIETTGNVTLYGPSGGPYKGLTVFQERGSNLDLTLDPGPGSSTACPGGFMTIGVPNGTAPAPCGALGGISGTIYAANGDATVFVTASGLADLQIIAGKIQIDSDANARFAYVPSKFANGVIRLIE